MAPRDDSASRHTKLVASNRRARYDYDVLDSFECGIALMGSEVKSARASHVQLKDSYAYVRGHELWLKGVHIAPYTFSQEHSGHEPERERKLLAHRSEIEEMRQRTEREQLTLVPLSVYFREGRVKVELGLVRGRKRHDKRHAMAERDAKRDVDRAMATQRRAE